MSVLAIDEPATRAEQWYTLKTAAAMCLFPSANALRMFLERHPEIAGVRYRTVGRSYQRVLTESELQRLQAAISRGPVKS